MKKYLIEDFIVGISKGGIACGPVSGHVVAELCLRNAEDNSFTYHTLTEYEGTLNFTKNSKSAFDILINEDYESTSALSVIEGSYAGGYTDYTEFYADLETRDEYHRLVWKLLAFLVRARWVELDQMKERCIGQSLESIEIPVCDVEQEYLDDLEEYDPMDDIRAEFVGLKISPDAFEFEEGETPEGYYSHEETIHSKDGNVYKCTFYYDLDADGVIVYIPRITARKLVDKDNDTYEETEDIPYEAYEALRNDLNGII